MIKKFLRHFLLFLIIPAIVVLSLFLGSGAAPFIAFVVAVLALLPFFFSFEKNAGTKHVVTLAVLIALTVLSRALFFAVPHYKPFAAMVIIAGIYLGKESGFLCGALSMFLSNFMFGQGPWTPFQMLGFGIIGLLAGSFAAPLKKNRVFLIIFGVFSAFLLSLITDLWFVMWIDGRFNLARYLALLGAALPITAAHAVSNGMFLMLLCKPIGEKIERIRVKFGF